MTYTTAIKESLTSGIRISYRYCETVLQINHPSKNINEAVRELRAQGVAIRECQDINHSSGKTFKEWVRV